MFNRCTIVVQTIFFTYFYFNDGCDNVHAVLVLSTGNTPVSDWITVHVVLGKHFFKADASELLENREEVLPCYSDVLQWRVTVTCYNDVLQWRVTVACYSDVLQWCVTCYNDVLQWRVNNNNNNTMTCVNECDKYEVLLLNL